MNVIDKRRIIFLECLLHCRKLLAEQLTYVYSGQYLINDSSNDITPTQIPTTC